MKEKDLRYYRLSSLAIWVDVYTKILYPCNKNGDVLKKDGVRLSDLNCEWFRLLDTEDKEFLSNLVNNN